LSHSAISLLVLYIYFFFLFFFLQYWDLNSGPSPWAAPPVLFLWRIFQDRVSRTICPGWLWTMILLISASWVARIIGMSHQYPANTCNLRAAGQHGKTLSQNKQASKKLYPPPNVKIFSRETTILTLWKSS
jgi:hypothetical protein